MKKIYLIYLVSSVCFLNRPCFGQNDVCTHLRILSSDSLEGRMPGTPGADMAAEYILKYFKSTKLELLGDKGLQTFEVHTGFENGENNKMVFNGEEFLLNNDFLPFPYSHDTLINTGIVFAGYGLSVKFDSLVWDDYSGKDVKGKWVMVLRGSPDMKKHFDRFASFSGDHSKMLTAKDHGAAGIIFVNGTAYMKQDVLIGPENEMNKNRNGIPTISVTRGATNRILNTSKLSIEALEISAGKAELTGQIEIKKQLYVSVNLNEKKIKTSNVIGVLRSTVPTDEYLVIGAHYDHLGFGGPATSSRKPDTTAVHNGADDNASGVACMMGLVSSLSKNKNLEKYNIIFIAFGAEEMGLLGSAWFLKHLPVGKKNIRLMLNFDMVGRLGTNKILSVGGTGTFADVEKILSACLDTNKIKLAFTKDGYGPSDHASFYSDSIPVLYFNTGVHADYHTPFDDYSKINCEGLETILSFTEKLILEINKEDYDLTYREAGLKTKGSERSSLKVTFGIMPDVANSDIKGVLVLAVNQDGPAYHAGIIKGDIITAINGNPVTNIYDYMERLKMLSAGQAVNVDVMRNGEKEVLLVQL